jgi:hypothetical protein
MSTKTKTLADFQKLSKPELLKIDISKLNRGELQSYMFVLGNHKRDMKKEMDTIDGILRSISLKVCRAAIR